MPREAAVRALGSAAKTANAAKRPNASRPAARGSREREARAAGAASAVVEILRDASPADLDRIERAASGQRRASLDPALWGDTPSRAEAVAGSIVNMRKLFEARRLIEEASISRAEAASLLGTSEQSIGNLLQAKRLVGFRRGRQWLLPAWQFDADTERGMLPGLRELVRVFPAGLVALSTWVLRPNPDLGGRAPRALLAEGQLQPVLTAAEALTSAGW